MGVFRLNGQDGKPDYRKMRSLESFQAGIDAVLDLAARHTVVLMCSEEDPSKCHRHLLIEPAMLQRGGGLMHIRGDGSVQHSDALSNNKSACFLFAKPYGMASPNSPRHT